MSSDTPEKPPVVVTDTTPDNFSFNAIEQAPVSEWIESETIQVRIKPTAYGEKSEVTVDIAEVLAEFVVTTITPRVLLLAEDEWYGNEIRETDLTPQGAVS